MLTVVWIELFALGVFLFGLARPNAVPLKEKWVRLNRRRPLRPVRRIVRLAAQRSQGGLLLWLLIPILLRSQVDSIGRMSQPR